MARNGKLVIRPDSGDPVKILTGYFDDEVGIDVGDKIYLRSEKDGPLTDKTILRTEYLGVVQKLWTIFGGTTTKTGHRLLDSHIGCIYGDSITLARAEEICTRLAQNNFASINWVAGVGSYTYQYQTRDTFGFALKATYGECDVPATDCPEPDGKECQGPCKHTETLCIEIQKDPITDDGTKKSLKGLIQIFMNETTGELEARDGVTWAEEEDSYLETVFEDGKLIKDYTLEEVRERLWPTAEVAAT